MAQDLQGYANSRDLKSFFVGTKKIFKPKQTAAGTLLAADNTILMEDNEIQNHWVEHFNTLLNRNSSAQQGFLQNVPQHPPQLWMSLPLTFQEFDAALKQMHQGKAVGLDNIPTELLTHGGKVLARILLNRLQNVAKTILPESQCGFRPSRGTIDMIFCAHQLQEKSKEQQKPIFLIFCDLEKAYDNVPRTAMWSVLNRFGIPEPFVDMVKALHDGMTAKVIHQSNLSAPFPITSGCVMAPTLFSLYLAAMLYEVPHNNPGVEIKYRLDGGIFKLARLKSQHNTNTINVTELQYADNNTAVTHTQAELQESVDNFHAAYTCFGLTVNKAKTKILGQPKSGGDLKKLEQFHQKKLRAIMKIKWSDCVPNIAVLERANVTSIEAMIMKHCLRWSGHVVWMEDTRLPKKILFSELDTGDRPRGCPML
ncbi:uncharacterized protein LOC143026786 [Oratosquilla oratoria]|uniref:uncharacterized protein LOC143026786 n=1 Tax=Oratosquilla oratoria TaxID=337810 RepID=UPI003F7708D7